MSEEILKHVGYPFQSKTWRAQPVKVVDGDTADLFVDTGFLGYHLFRFRFLDIDTPEMNSEDEDERKRAKDAKEFVQDVLDCPEKTLDMHLGFWPLRIETEKNPDSFGRWLCRIFWTDSFGEHSVNAELLERGLADPYKK